MRSLHDKITAQAKGIHPAEAAALLITTALDGRLPNQLIIAWETDTMAEIDWDESRQTLGYLSGGERRIFDLADSLATGQPINLGHALVGLDDTNARIALRAIACALQVSVPLVTEQGNVR